MNNIILTDIFGFSIKNNTKYKDYIIIEIPYNIYNSCLNGIGQYNGNIIYSLNRYSQKLNNVFLKNNLKLNDYLPLGNYISHNHQSIKIIVGNKTIIEYTTKYSLIDTVNDLYIWKPITDNSEYTNLGVLCTRNDSMPDIGTCLILKNNCNIFNIHNSLNELFVGDYSLLNCVKDGKRKIIALNLLKHKHINKSSNIEHFANDNVTNNNTNINETYETYETTNDENDWSKYRGKQVVLVSENNPWYINKNATIPLKYISNDNFLGANIFKNNYALYDSKVVLDNDTPSLGYGYSYASRRNVETFKNDDENNEDDEDDEEKDTTNSDKIILLLFIILLLLFIYNIYYKKKYVK